MAQALSRQRLRWGRVTEDRLTGRQITGLFSTGARSGWGKGTYLLPFSPYFVSLCHKETYSTLITVF